jgi:hypothetical protein
LLKANKLRSQACWILRCSTNICRLEHTNSPNIFLRWAKAVLSRCWLQRCKPRICESWLSCLYNRLLHISR